MTTPHAYNAADALRIVAEELDAHPGLPRPEFIAIHGPYAADVLVAASFRFEKAEDAHERRANVAAVDAWATVWGAPVEPQVGGNRGARTHIDGIELRALRPAYELRELDEGCRHPEHHTHRSVPGAA
jgi:hypothetical protein